jgi:nucleoside-diphosphate-sugar epimerase
MLIDEDASYLAEKMSPLLQYLKNSSVLITGGTGFFGKWLLESILLVNRVYLTDINAYVVTRNSSRFVSEFPEFLNPHINFLTADVSHLKQIPDIDYVIHAATSVNNFRKSSSALETFDTVVLGTKNILELAKGAKLKGFLLVSSGGVYGDQPPELEKISELYRGGPDFFDSKNTYGEAKRIAENLGVIYRDIYSVPVKTARCFSFIGPYLSGGHFCSGKFHNKCC